MRKLNWDKELKKVQKRGLYNPKVRVFSIIAIALLTLGIGLTFSAFSYSSGDVQAFNSQIKKKVKVIITVTNGSGTVNTTTNYKSSGTIEYSVTPNIGYILDEANTTCNYNSSTKKVIITPNKDTNCTVKFIWVENLLTSKILSADTLKTNPVWSDTSTDKGLYQLSGDKTIDGNPTYYYRGNVENNYVKFGTNSHYPIFYTYSKETSDSVYSCFYSSSTNEEMNDCVNNEANAIMITPMGADLIWRIVRITEDGTIRLILDTNESQLFQHQHNDAWGLGANFEHYNLQYYDSINESHTPISLELYNFINSCLTSTQRSKLKLSKICNTGLITEGNYSVEESNGKQYILSHREMINDTLACLEEEKINVSISMITAPEFYYASTVWKINGAGVWNYNSYFNSFADKNISDGFLTMSLGDDYFANVLSGNISDYFGTYSKGSPYVIEYYSSGNSDIEVIDGLSYLYNHNTYVGIRPVINLRADVAVSSGNGTKNNPYVIN